MTHELKLDNVTVTWLGHASFRITDGNFLAYIDPYVLPDDAESADLILVTHDHFDHFDADKIESLKKRDTVVIGAHSCIDKLGYGRAVRAGEKINIASIAVDAVEAHNTNKFRSPGQPFHPKGLGIGFVLELNGKRIYHSGDTDHIPEMSHLKNIDAALLPIGGTYTMTVTEAAEAALDVKPKNLVPMHFNSDKYGVTGINANPIELAKALVGKGIMVRILDPLV